MALRRLILMAAACMVVLSACGTPGPAVVDSVDVHLLNSYPAQVDVVVKGYLPSGCEDFGDITQSFDKASRTFTVAVTMVRYPRWNCPAAIRPFENHVRLDGVVGLPKGTYTVKVNDKITTFTLTMDNGPAPTP